MTDAVLLRPSAFILAFLKRFETCARPLRARPGFFTAYKPTPQDRWTCGWGTTGADVGASTVWAQSVCDARFDRDAGVFAADVNTLLAGRPTTQGQFDALFSFAYNVGPDMDHDGIAEGLGDSTLLKKHLAGDYAGAAAEFVKWNKQRGVVLDGLTRRREAEAAIYRGQE